MEPFLGWPKIARWNRDIRISEKLDGSNAAVVIADDSLGNIPSEFAVPDEALTILEQPSGDKVYIWAQSRTRVIQPGKQTDNYGFAQWVKDNAGQLFRELGYGRHFGEWAGYGIQSLYAKPEESRPRDKHFWLFPHHYDTGELDLVRSVPVLYEGYNCPEAIDTAIAELRYHGSVAYPGCEAEGIIIEHLAARVKFKITLEGDEVPKGQAERQRLIEAEYEL